MSQDLQILEKCSFEPWGLDEKGAFVTIDRFGMDMRICHKNGPFSGCRLLK